MQSHTVEFPNNGHNNWSFVNYLSWMFQCYLSIPYFIDQLTTGIVPVTCEELFKGIENKTGTGIQFEVVLGMLEIYNEQVNALYSIVDQR